MDKQTEIGHIIAAVKVAYSSAEYTKVENLLLSALEDFPQNNNLLYWLSQFYSQQREFNKLAVLLSDINLSDELLNLYINALRALKKHEHAIEILLALPTISQSMKLLLAILFKEVGNVNESIIILDELIGGNEQSINAAWQKAQMKEGLTNSQLRQLENDIDITSLPSDIKATRAYTLANAYDARGDFRRAFDFYKLGAKAKLSTFKNYSPEQDIIEFKRIISAFKTGSLACQTSCNHSAPIFIVGMPRTGTTLVEQIISSHSHVTGADELSDLAFATQSVIMKVKPKNGYPDWADELTSEHYNNIAQKYLDLTKEFQQTHYFSDKMPLNFKALGIIFRAFPNAKVIHCQRSAMDTIWGNFRQLFGGGINFSYDLKHLAHYYLGYKALMEHWSTLYPSKILTVDYETLVSDQKAVIETLLDYLQLSVEPECFEFYNSKRVVHTLSNQQVRQPIFKSGVNRWKNYEFALQEVKNILNGE